MARWLLNGEASQPDSTFSFLEKLDEFDLNDYIRAVRFNQLKVPTLPFQLPSFKTHYGLENFRQAHLDFLRSTALSRSREPVFMCSDMPMEELVRDMEFSKKWMLGLAAILKKGLRLNMVHDLNRPYAEMMLGLESWIPLYMTGQIAPWYLRGKHNSVYGHLLFCSGAAAVEGECIAGDFGHGRFLFCQAKRDLPYYRRRADALLQMAHPLMDIYRDASEGAYSSFLFANAHEAGEYRAVLTALPPHTLSDECLTRLLKKIGVQKKDCVDITLRNLLESGSVLFSRAVSSQVLSALRGLTSVFGMGTGGSLSPLPPEILFSFLSSSFPENCTDPFPLRFLCLRFRLTYGFRFLALRFFHTLLRLLLFPENSP